VFLLGGRMKTISRTRKDRIMFSNGVHKSYRGYLYQDLSRILVRYSQLDGYDKVFVLRMCIHKIEEGGI